MTYVILILVGFIAGVLCAGYVVAAIGGLKTDLALARAKLTLLETDAKARLSTIEEKLHL